MTRHEDAARAAEADSAEARAAATTPPPPDPVALPSEDGARGALALSGPGGPLSRLYRSRSVRASLFAFALTRLLVFSLIVLASQFEVSHPDPQSDYGAGSLSLNRTAFARIIRRRTSVADCSWYMSIVQGGYDRGPFSTVRSTNWAFFPLFPLVWRAAWRLTGELHLTAVALSSAWFFCALVIVHRLALAYGFTGRDADRAVFYLAAFPVSYFFSLPMTESLFLLLTAGSFYAAKRERWLVAGLAGALASATRSTGVLLLPALAVVYWETYRTFRPRRDFLPLLLVPAGLLSFMFFLHRTTGNAFAFKDILVTWGRKPTFFLLTLFDYVRDPLLLAVPWDFRLLNFLAASGALACGVALLRRRQWSLALYTLASLFVSLSSGLLQSHARYASVLFPAFFVLAAWGRNPRADRIVRTVFLILLTLMTILFTRDIDIALA